MSPTPNGLLIQTTPTLLTSLMSHICVQVKTCSGGGYTVCFFLSSATNAISCKQNRGISAGVALGQQHGSGSALDTHVHEVGLGELRRQLPPPALPEARRNAALVQPPQCQLFVPAHPLQLLRAQR